MSQSIRSFVAVPLSAPIAPAIENLIRRLSKSIEGVNWVRPGNLHLTLKFLGEIGNRDLPQVCGDLKSIASSIEPFHLQARGVGVFPSEDNPRVIWAGVIRGQDELTQMHHEFDRSMVQIGVRRDGRAFTPHITLGRVVRNRDPEQILGELQRYTATDFGTSRIDQIQLLASYLDRSPGKDRKDRADESYQIMARARLGAHAPESPDDHPADEFDEDELEEHDFGEDSDDRLEDYLR